jgi:Baseplate J-like protein
MTIVNQEALAERARNLGTLNGFWFVLVDLQPPATPTEARLEVHFLNANHVAVILADATASAAAARQTFPITGGHRLRAGAATGQVQVTGVAAGAAPEVLVLTVAPIGDYSTYRLSIVHGDIDPIFSEIGFKFRPGCFSIDCAPEWPKAPAPKPAPAIDYLAKDYESFRHTMIAAMMQRVPGWQPTSEADLDQTLLELFSVSADELSDYQDRVMSEAYIGTARKRVSLARHARLMDYHIHQGNQASTWIAFDVPTVTDGTLPPGLAVWTGDPRLRPESQVFVSRHDARLHGLLSRMSLYTWSDAIPALAAGSTSADLRLTSVAMLDAVTVQNVIRNGEITRLLIQEWLNPATGRPAGRDPGKRQLLSLLPGAAGATAMQDPLTAEWFVRVRWAEKDKLQHNYCFVVDCAGTLVRDVSLFHGNLVEVFHGRSAAARFVEPGAILAGPDQHHFERTDDGTDRWGTLCRFPDGPLAYRATAPGGEVPSQSTLSVTVELNGAFDDWDEQINLIHSDDGSESGDHFLVETDEEGRSLIRFGNGVNGRKLPPDAIVHCSYQVGRGLDGNVGADTLVNFDASFDPLLAGDVRGWNPFDVINGLDPEPVAEIIRRVPEAYRYRQLRAVTLQDYVRRAEEVPEVSRAAARYAWTGSWRTVQIAIDPVGTTTFDDELRRRIARHLDAVRLIGEDLEIRPPRFVPLDIRIAICIDPEHWPEDVRFVLEQEFAEGYTPDGRLGFFHPDLWTFGQELHASQLLGRVQAVEGVEHVISVTMKRWDAPTPGTDAILAVRGNEIIRVRNDPDHMEEGFIQFDLQGGRQ